jgi:GDP-mannose 6-dehydrogenase
MRISVFGLGYVGCVSAACLAAQGHEVVGVDVQQAKVELLNQGHATVIEDQLGHITRAAVRSGGLRATTNVAEALSSTDVCLVCVGTPSAANGSLSTAYLERVAHEIGTQIGQQEDRQSVVFRSTMLPGTCENLLIPILEKASGLQAGLDFGVAVNPEYLREGSSVRDFHEPSKIVIGEVDTASGDIVAELYDGLPGEIFRVPIAVAEMTKYVDNAFHGLKVAFANEIGSICHALGLDSHYVMDIFLADRKLNISTAYLRPGFAFGGSCLPKDLRGLVYAARQADVAVPLLESVLPSNEHHVRRALELVTQIGKRRVGMFGLSFKAGTDDLRESPSVDLAERLIGKGYDVRIYDANVSLSHLLGANRKYVDTHLPHLRRLLTDSAEEVVEHAEVCVIGSQDATVYKALRSSGDRPIVDLVRAPDSAALRGRPGYVELG